MTTYKTIPVDRGALAEIWIQDHVETGESKEMAQIIKRHPEVIDRVRILEQKLGRTFFAPNYIPEWAHTSRDPKSGKSICFIDDMVKYRPTKTMTKSTHSPMTTRDVCRNAYVVFERTTMTPNSERADNDE